MKELKTGWGKPTGATVGEPKKEQTHEEEPKSEKEGMMSSVKVGTKAPDFEAPAF